MKSKYGSFKCEACTLKLVSAKICIFIFAVWCNCVNLCLPLGYFLLGKKKQKNRTEHDSFGFGAEDEGEWGSGRIWRGDGVGGVWAWWVFVSFIHRTLWHLIPADPRGANQNSEALPLSEILCRLCGHCPYNENKSRPLGCTLVCFQ